VLSNRKFHQSFGFGLESWQEGLARVVAALRRREAERAVR
jgi:hypothetical protein